MLSKFLDPKNDVAFKKIFGTQKNQDILIHFLNDVLIFKNKSEVPVFFAEVALIQLSMEFKLIYGAFCVFFLVTTRT